MLAPACAILEAILFASGDPFPFPVWRRQATFPNGNYPSC